jgi:hypothetical protein
MNRALRAGDVDRRRVVADLQQHYVEGRLSSEELSERVERAHAARTLGDLDELTGDLPEREQQEEQPSKPRWWAKFVSVPGLVLLGMVAILVLTWLVWLPNGGAFTWPVLFIGGFFFFRWSPGRRSRS